MFWTRLISGIILIALAVGAIWKGGYILAGVLLVLTIAGMREYYKAAGLTGHPMTWLELAAYIAAVIYYAVLVFAEPEYLMPALAGGCLLILVMYVATYPAFKTLEAAGYIYPLLYIAVMLGFMYMIRCRFKGNIEVWLIFLSSWGADTCAYCVGRLIGRHKMSPKLSPKKSVEGAIGGVVGAGLLGVIYALIFKQPIVIYMLICMVTAVISMFGDLTASAVKREAGIKDYSHLIPGHGGILDRFDSVLFAAPAVYLSCLMFLS